MRHADMKITLRPLTPTEQRAEDARLRAEQREEEIRNPTPPAPQPWFTPSPWLFFVLLLPLTVVFYVGICSLQFILGY